MLAAVGAFDGYIERTAVRRIPAAAT